jgi:hypothetical protein
MKKREIKFIEGFSQSAWKSLAIKSIRIGWVDGLQKCSSVLSKSEMTTLMVGSLFEDIFPIRYKDLDEAYTEIKNQDWESLCTRNTLHGRGYGQAFFDMADEACSSDREYNEGIVRAIRSNTQLTWINPRVYNCLYTWYKINPNGENYYRLPLYHKWNGMPKIALDGHTYEGKRSGQDCLLLSGHYENHLVIANRVMNEGWEILRNEFINSEIATPKNLNPTLF